MLNSNQYLTSTEASKYLRIDPKTLKRWRERGIIKAVKKANIWLYDWDDLTAYLTKSW